ncbi:MAG: hypothetical protein ACOY93_05070 [Bacillota bacterium]
MRQRIPWAALVLVMLTLLGGCGGQPATPEAAAGVARAFMDARVAGDAGSITALLTARAQQAIPRSLVSRHLERAQVSYGGLGEPSSIEEGVVRIPVRELKLVEGDRTIQWPERWLTLRYEGERWRVAWVEPLFDEAMEAFMNNMLTDQLELGHQIVAIDPYHYRGYLELHFAYRDLQRYREAEVAIREALLRATPAEEPDAYDAMARFKLAIKAPAEALAYARRALELAGPFTPETYPARWQADTLVVAGRAALAMGDRAAAEEYASQAAAVDPESAALAIFRHQLAEKPGGPPPAP